MDLNTRINTEIIKIVTKFNQDFGNKLTTTEVIELTRRLSNSSTKDITTNAKVLIEHLIAIL